MALLLFRLFLIAFLRDIHNDFKLRRSPIPLHKLRFQQHMTFLSMDQDILFPGIKPRLVDLTTRTIPAGLTTMQDSFITGTSPKLFALQIEPLHHRLIYSNFAHQKHACCNAL